MNVIQKKERKSTILYNLCISAFQWLGFKFSSPNEYTHTPLACSISSYNLYKFSNCSHELCFIPYTFWTVIFNQSYPRHWKAELWSMRWSTLQLVRMLHASTFVEEYGFCDFTNLTAMDPGRSFLGLPVFLTLGSTVHVVSRCYWPLYAQNTQLLSTHFWQSRAPTPWS